MLVTKGNESCSLGNERKKVSDASGTGAKLTWFSPLSLVLRDLVFSPGDTGEREQDLLNPVPFGQTLFLRNIVSYFMLEWTP